MSLLDRFRHIERSRSGRPEDAAEPSAETAGRFEGVECPIATPAVSAASGADLERFGPAPPPRIELVEISAGERPFTRCMRCGMDHHVSAPECTGCGASLYTAAQRDFNGRLWSRRQEAARGALAAEEHRSIRAREEAELAASRRAMGEELARRVGALERRRIEAEERGAGLGRWLSILLGGRRRW